MLARNEFTGALYLVIPNGALYIIIPNGALYSLFQMVPIPCYWSPLSCHSKMEPSILSFQNGALYLVIPKWSPALYLVIPKWSPLSCHSKMEPCPLSCHSKMEPSILSFQNGALYLVIPNEFLFFNRNIAYGSTDVIIDYNAKSYQLLRHVLSYCRPKMWLSPR